MILSIDMLKETVKTVKITSLLHLGLGIDLCPSVQQESDHDHIPPPGRNVQRSDAVLQKDADSLRQACKIRPDINRDEDIIPDLWGEVDICSSVEQQLSYIQVFIVCSNVEGCESSLHEGKYCYNYGQTIETHKSNIQQDTHTAVPC